MLEGKRLGLLHEMVPTATTIAVLINPTRSVAADIQVAEVREAAAGVGVMTPRHRVRRTPAKCCAAVDALHVQRGGRYGNSRQKPR
jgi:hypothetical protein